MEHCLVYFSSSVKPLDEKELSTLLSQSRRNNARLGVTGVLLYVRGSIIQVLEGEKKVVNDLFQRIAQDSRHTQVSRVFSRSISERLFKAWTMGFETLTTRQFDELKTIIDLTDPEERVINPTDHILLKTIKVFYESTRFN